MMMYSPRKDDVTLTIYIFATQPMGQMLPRTNLWNALSALSTWAPVTASGRMHSRQDRMELAVLQQQETSLTVTVTV